MSNINDQVAKQNLQAVDVSQPDYLSKALTGEMKRELEGWRHNRPHRTSLPLARIVAEVGA